MATTQIEANADFPSLEGLAEGPSLGLIFNVAAGAGLASMGSWSAAAQRIAPLLADPSLLSAAIEGALALSEAARLAPQQAKLRLEVIPEIAERVAELRKDAADTGEPFSEASDAAFRTFVGNLALTRRPSIFLLDNGDLSAVWDNSDGELVNLQFSGEGAIQYAAFRKRDGAKNLETLAGVGDSTEVLALLLKIRHLIQ